MPVTGQTQKGYNTMPVSKALKSRLKDTVNSKSAEVPSALEKQADSSLITVKKLELDLNHLKIITPDNATPEQYQQVDTYRAGVDEKMKEWAADIRPAIDPIKAGVLALEKLDRKVRQPLEKLYAGATEWMRLYKIAESRKAQIEQQKAEQLRIEAQRVITQAEQLTSGINGGASKRATERFREKLIQSSVELEKQADQVVEAVTVTQADSSDSRGKIKWRVAGSMVQEDCEKGIPWLPMSKILAGIAEGKIPYTVLQLDTKFINATFKAMPEQVMEWPGFETYEDFIIARR